jgi:hypothetical protein
MIWTETLQVRNRTPMFLYRLLHLFPATYTLIHAFLTKRSHTKVALALKKAVKDVVILKDVVDVEGPQLDEIVKQWKVLTARKENLLEYDPE